MSANPARPCMASPATSVCSERPPSSPPSSPSAPSASSSARASRPRRPPQRPAAGPVIDNTSMSGPRSAAQKGLGSALNPRVQFASDAYVVTSGLGAGTAATSGVDGRFAAQYERCLARCRLPRSPRTWAPRSPIRRKPALGSSSRLRSFSRPRGTALAAQYQNWLKAQSLAIGTDFPDMFQRQANMSGGCLRRLRLRGSVRELAQGPGRDGRLGLPGLLPAREHRHHDNVGEYAGTNFAGQYDMWLKAQAMATGSDFPDWFERVPINTGTYGLDGYGGSDSPVSTRQWLKAQAAASWLVLPGLLPASRSSRRRREWWTERPSRPVIEQGAHGT